MIPHREPQGIQLRFSISITLENYLSQEAWRWKLLSACPLHPAGGCGFCRHGSYLRHYPVAIKIARYYCRKGKITFSLLPDVLASRVSGTLDEIEQAVTIAESSASFVEAAETLRPADPSKDCFREHLKPHASSAKSEDLRTSIPEQEAVTMEAALFWLRRRRSWVTALLTTVVGLMPETFTGCTPTISGFRERLGTFSVLVALRELCHRHLAELSAPFGFLQRRSPAGVPQHGSQQSTGPP